MLVHHYTNIDTLALILDTGRIRFNRLDKVDDLSEVKNIKFGNFIFVSCWTSDPEESIPLWKMYTNKMAGVRITLDSDWLWYRPLGFHKNYIRRNYSKKYSPILVDECWTDIYRIPDIYFKYSDPGCDNNIMKEIKYVDNPKEMYRDLFSKKDGKWIIKTYDLATYKAKSWDFQKEIRYVLYINPSIPLPEYVFMNEDFQKKFSENLEKSRKKRIGPNIEYIDIEVNPVKLKKIEVILGPACSGGDEIIVKSLLKKYAPRGKCKQSMFTGQIRSR